MAIVPAIGPTISSVSPPKISIGRRYGRRAKNQGSRSSHARAASITTPRACPTVIRKKVRSREVPRLRATSSWTGSADRRLAATGR